jgi:large subunit ribosomal protein L35
MPKIKTRSAAKKRFKMLPSGKIKRSKAFRRHLLTCKTRKSKRHLRESAYVNASDMRAIARLLPNG